MAGHQWPGPIVRESLAALEEAVHSLVRRLRSPLLVVGQHQRFRFPDRTSQHIQILKAVRIVSGLHASLALIEAGYTQEAGVLFRTIHEFLQEILFLHEAHYNAPNEVQKQFIEQFFAKDLRTTEQMMAGTPTVSRVGARKKRASVTRLLGEFDNAELVRRRMEAIDDQLSGYVHGEYPQIMDMYEGTANGTGERFCMRGMVGTSHVEQFQRWFSVHLHPVLNGVGMILHDVGDIECKDKLLDIRNRLEESDEYPNDRHGELSSK